MALDGHMTATVCGTFRADVRTGDDAHVALHLVMPDGTTLTVNLERLPSWVTEEPTEDDKRRERHRTEDRLPKSRYELLADILSANGVRDHDSAQADADYHAWKRNGRKGSKSRPDLGGMLDSFACVKDRAKPCCLLEAFERDSKGCTTWRDIMRVLPALADALNVEELRLPDDILDRHIAQDAEVNHAGE